jgi:hypothetical protein
MKRKLQTVISHQNLPKKKVHILVLHSPTQKTMSHVLQIIHGPQTKASL